MDCEIVEMLQIEKLTVTQKKDLRCLIKDFSVVLNEGDKAVIIGEEGNGKSTLLKWIYEPELVQSYAECEGQRLLGMEKPGYLPQELAEEEKGKTLYEFFSETETFWEQTPGELGALCKQFHVENVFFYSDQTMEMLSGGEKIKAQMMRMLMERPAVLFISHDETLIARTANRIIHIEQLHRKQQSHITVSKNALR